MGWGAVMGIAAGVGVISDIFGASEQASAASSAEQAIQLQGKEQQLSYTQQQTKNYLALQKTTSSSIAQASATGFASNSASFNAINRNIYNNFAVNAQNLDTEQAINQTNTATETQNVQDQLYGSWMSDLGNLASTSFWAARSIPS